MSIKHSFFPQLLPELKQSRMREICSEEASRDHMAPHLYPYNNPCLSGGLRKLSRIRSHSLPDAESTSIFQFIICREESEPIFPSQTATERMHKQTTAREESQTCLIFSLLPS
jgi:hypothetical protein